MIHHLQCVFEFWLLTIINKYLYVIALSREFVSLGDNLFFDIMLKVLSNVSRIILGQGSMPLPWLQVKTWFKVDVVGTHFSL